MEEEKKLTGYASIDKPWEKYYSDMELRIRVPEMTLTDYLYEKNRDRLQLPALRYLGKRITYKELFEIIDSTGARFNKLGVKKGDSVALAMPLTPEVIYMIYGLNRIGASANLIDPRIPSERMNYYLNLVHANLAVVISPYINSMCIAAKNSSINTIISVSPLASLDKSEQQLILKTRYTTHDQRTLIAKDIKSILLNIAYNIQHFKHKRILNYKAFYNCCRDMLRSVQYDKDSVAIIEYTSGTTGIPKGLELTAQGMNATAEQISIINHTTPGDSILSIMPPFISYGAVTGIHMSLASGMEMILVPDFSTDHFAALIKEHKPNNIICVPSMFEHVIKSNLLREEDLSYIKRVIFGGDRTTPDFEKEVNHWLSLHNAPITLIKGGGMAEFSSCCFETPFEVTKKPGIYGIPLPLVDAKIMKDDQTECGYHEIGEIYISSPQQMRGYVNNPIETEAFFFTDENGQKWGRSGDLGFVEEDGTFTLTSRKKQMIIRPDGHNVFPGEIEAVIKSCDCVRECVVIGIRDRNSVIGEYPVALIELKDNYLHDADRTLLQIRSVVEKSIPIRDRPEKDAYFSVRMIYSSEGKIDRKAMAEELQNQLVINL